MFASPSASSLHSSGLASGRAQVSPYFDPFGIVGPLGNNYCLIFYFIAIFLFFSFLIAVVKLVMHVIQSKTSVSYLIAHVIAVSFTFVLYLEARVLYNMCLNSV